MITKFTISNFKRLDTVEIEFGNPVVFICPTENLGKNSALQALALWDAGWRRWAENVTREAPPKGQVWLDNRRDLNAVPVSSARLLWHDLPTRETICKDGKQKTQNVFIRLTAEGIHRDKPWICASEFLDFYANEESFYCRLVEPSVGRVPEGARAYNAPFLPPLSGLAEREYREETEEIAVFISEGRTSKVLRNLCWQLYHREDPSVGPIYFNTFDVCLASSCMIQSMSKSTAKFS
jgi:hypothetical protein